MHARSYLDTRGLIVNFWEELNSPASELSLITERREKFFSGVGNIFEPVLPLLDHTQQFLQLRPVLRLQNGGGGAQFAVFCAQERQEDSVSMATKTWLLWFFRAISWFKNIPYTTEKFFSPFRSGIGGGQILRLDG